MDAPLRLAPSSTKRTAGAVAFAAYAACIPFANILITHYGPVPVGFGLMAPAGVYVAGLAFTARDLVQRWLGKRWALLAVAAGTALAFLLASPALALASALAFLVAELADMAVFAPLERKTLIGAVLASNTVGVVLDSVIFLSLAFGSLAFLPGQVVGKLLMTLPVLAVLVPMRIKARAS